MTTSEPHSSTDFSLPPLRRDLSVRYPVLLFFACAIIWLVVASLVGLLAALELVLPDAFGGSELLTFGRIRPVHVQAMVMGWCSNAAMGFAFWALSQLCQRPLSHPSVLIVSTLAWNIALTMGLVGILAGDGLSLEWSEVPGYAQSIMLLALFAIAAQALTQFFSRAPGPVFVSECYIIAGFLWFSWSLAIAGSLLIWNPVPAPAQVPLVWWHAHNVIGFWLTPLALAAAFLLIPLSCGTSPQHHRLSMAGFWAMCAVSSWNGMHHLIGGPVPPWMVAWSVITSFLMVVPLVASLFVLWTALRSAKDFSSPALRFLCVGVASFAASGAIGILMSLPGWNSLTHFTDFTIGHAHLGVYGFVSMVFFGVIHFLLPQIFDRPWPFPRASDWQFWGALCGLVLMVVSLLLGGFLQGFAQMDPGLSFRSSLDIVSPFRWVRALAGFLLICSHGILACHFVAFFWVSPKPSRAELLR